MDDDFASLFLPDILQERPLSNSQNALDDEEQFNFLETPNDIFSPLISRPFSHYTNLVPLEARTPQVFPTVFEDASRNNSDIPDLPQLHESAESCELLDLTCQSTGIELLSKSGSRAEGAVFSGFLDGKFFTSSDDEADRFLERKPIACYRRNFITVNCSLEWDPTIDRIIYFGQPHKIDRLRISLAAATSFSDEILEMLVFKDKKVNSDSHQLITSSGDFRPLKSQKFQFKKTQFKKATPNNGKSTLRNYFFVLVTLEAVLHNGNSVALLQLKSNPIMVRRNPSFYTGRNETVVSRREYEVPSRTETKAISQELEEEESDVDESESNYHYIPIKPVYSMPPVDVSYVPHSVHNAKPRVLLGDKQGQSGYKYFLK